MLSVMYRPGTVVDLASVPLDVALSLANATHIYLNEKLVVNNQHLWDTSTDGWSSLLSALLSQLLVPGCSPDNGLSSCSRC